MASQTPASGQDSFAKAFVPGLVLGLIIGAVLGAVVPPFFESSPKMIAPDPDAVRDTEPRDEGRGAIDDIDTQTPDDTPTLPDDDTPTPPDDATPPDED